ncbi:hypothetical protein [Vulcanococcus limneticus]|uniref:hypothetical protein n=1 Tax=Vulcanococcus limneticus TaxID=2170428 RepID=UPI00398C054D
MVLGTALGGLLGGCAAPPPPQEQVKGPARDDCLREVRLDALQTALERCDAVVAAYPRDPQPRNERALLQALAGNRVAACSDSSAAEVLLRQAAPGRRGDPQLVEEIRIRAAGCRG